MKYGSFRNIIAYNNVVPFGYSLRSVNFKGLAKDVLTGFINPFKKYKPGSPVKDFSLFKNSEFDPDLLSRDAAFRKALKIDLLPRQKGLYYDRSDGTVGINYTHPLATDNLEKANFHTALIFRNKQ